MKKMSDLRSKSPGGAGECNLNLLPKGRIGIPKYHIQRMISPLDCNCTVPMEKGPRSETLTAGGMPRFPAESIYVLIGDHNILAYVHEVNEATREPLVMIIASGANLDTIAGTESKYAGC